QSPCLHWRQVNGQDDATQFHRLVGGRGRHVAGERPHPGWSPGAHGARVRPGVPRPVLGNPGGTLPGIGISGLPRGVPTLPGGTPLREQSRDRRQLPGGLSVRRSPVSRRIGRAQQASHLGANRDSLRRRRGLSVAQSRPLRHLQSRRGHVLIYVHKEEALADVERRYPADHYVMVDDKLRILAALKKAWGGRVTTVFPRQGKFANDPMVLAGYPNAADVTVDRIGDLLAYELADLLAKNLQKAKRG